MRTVGLLTGFALPRGPHCCSHHGALFLTDQGATSRRQASESEEMFETRALLIANNELLDLGAAGAKK
jgi:hypothetical protein